MKIKSVVLSLFVTLLQIINSSQDCRVINEKDASNYICNSIQDLEQQGNPLGLNVTISDGRLPSPSLKPSLTVSLPNNVEHSHEVYGYIKNVFNLWNRQLQLRVLKAETFYNLPLKSLRINKGYLVDIEPGTFSRMKELTEIYITDNNLRSVSTGVFNYLNIETLALSNNQIRLIERDALSNLKNLKYLYLDGNQISSFRSDNLMNYKSQLDTLHLQRNSLSTIDSNTFRGFEKLRILDLSDNKIDKIINYSFEELLNLESLVLANNFIRDLDAEIFPLNAFARLLKFNIANNNLSYLTTTTLEKIKQVRFISIVGNPWQCGCLNLILTWIGDHNVKQMCVGDYFKGLRPICAVGKNRNLCDYSVNNQEITTYIEENNQFRGNGSCVI